MMLEQLSKPKLVMEKFDDKPERLANDDAKVKRIGKYVLAAPNEFIAEYWSMRYPDWEIIVDNKKDSSDT